MTQGESFRRVSLVGGFADGVATDLRAPTRRRDVDAVAEQRDEHGLLLSALEEIIGLLRSSEPDLDRGDGVLLDVVVGGMHCVVVEHRPSLLVALSPREKQVAVMVARGRTNQAIANALEISVWTVSTHLRRVFAKLAVSSRAEMVAHLLADREFSSQLGAPPAGPATLRRSQFGPH
ncbi:helix-turn-helix transcriptional regulator [Demequina mangrovi]|uniref:DNA-binding transcriptional regulator, CsgD family n=1 Tax=Demequina mangrovi TaxID=1043493 RepID=A0A1H6UJD8_9MICO|nr:helix-turn-helix transcriptional regulator [Demequina mangrovi]SEI92433.1 DNA-binding transcriptional regulator, CsgD family [Demequina mangrovi]